MVLFPSDALLGRLAIEGRAYGYPEKFYLLIGLVELLGAPALLVPRRAAYGATLLIAVMIGATVTHLLHSEASRALVAAVLMVLLGIVAYARRPDFVGRKQKSELNDDKET